MVPALAVAPNVTAPEPQTKLGVDAVMVGIVFTVIVTELDDAVEGEAQGSLEVITQLTICPFVNPALV
jgi:hypothetical protein